MNSTHDDRGQSWWNVFPAGEHGARQINLSWMHPGAIKGLHAHKLQYDYWFCAAGALLVITAERDNVPIEQVRRRVLYPGDPFICIEPGLWHGCRALGNQPALLVYGVTEKYDPKEPDEQRLPWDHFGREIWEMQPR